MGKGKATNGKKAKRPAKPAARPKSARAPAVAKSTKPAEKPAEKPAVAAPRPPVTPTLPTPIPGLKKRNVKRGAPPMLPRRMVRRPEPPPPGSTPPPPRPPAPAGSLHAPARAPEGAEGLKQRLGTVMTLVAQLRGLKRTLNRQFYEAGLILQKLSEPTLYQAKGYGTFESFVEREIERELAIGRSLAHDLVQIVKVFQRDAAEEIGLERLRQALRALWPEPGPQAASSGSATSG